MALWSYFQTIRTNNYLVKLAGAPNVYVDDRTDSNFLSKKCEECKYYKPPLVSHCSTCGNCIMKLDHHCIWAQNCIGYRNHKSFYLFTLYMSIGVFQFWQATYMVFGKLYGTCKFFSHFESGVYILWIITCFSACFVGIMILSLLICHTLMILSNHTTLMSVKQKSMFPMPFCEFRSSFLNNESVVMHLFLGKSLWSWWDPEYKRFIWCEHLYGIFTIYETNIAWFPIPRTTSNTIQKIDC
jgi:hypothetical protein